MGGTLGMEVGRPLPPCSMRRPPPAKLDEFFRSKKGAVDLVFVVVPDKRTYGKVLIC